MNDVLSGTPMSARIVRRRASSRRQPAFVKDSTSPTSISIAVAGPV